MKKGLLAVGVLFAGLIGLVIIALIWAVGVNNKMVQKSNAADAQWAQVQNVYQRRADLIPNLVKTVEGAANFERSTLKEVVDARASATQVKVDPNAAPADPNQLRQFEAAQNQLGSALSRLLVVVEKYPELRANQNFQTLQAQLEGSDNRIAVERGRYNDTLRDYNTYIQKVPANIIAGFRNFQPKPYFAATPGAERPPEVQFNFGKTGATN